MSNDKNTLFTDTPVKSAVLTLAIPTVISQLITVVYNMADTFFIGQLNDPLQVAAATIAMPCFMFLTAFANLVAMLYFIGFLFHIRKKTVITLNPTEYSLKQNIPLEVRFISVCNCTGNDAGNTSFDRL